MRARPVRRNIYLPVVRFGVADSDWFSVLLISCGGYLAPIPFGITVLYVPLQMWTWLLATAGSIAFFNYIRIGRKPYWLQHKVKALFLHHRQHRAIPNGRKRAFNRSWIINLETKGVLLEFADRPDSVTQTTRLLERNSRSFQEALEERWNEFSLTTN
jgi:hypothetical protein